MRRHVLKSALVVVSAMVVCVGTAAVSMAAATATIRVASKMPPESPEGIGFQRFADLARQYGGGRLEVIVYPSEQLGGTDATLEQLRAGTIDIYVEGATYLQRYVPDMKVGALPFLFRSREQWVRFVQSDLYRSWVQRLTNQFNITILGSESDFVRGPYRVLLTRKPVHNLADLRGVRLRMPPDETSVQVWGYLGAVPQILEWTEVYEAIARGIVEGVTSPIALVESMGFHEVAPYIVRTNEYPQGIAFMMNARKWRSLSPELQEALLKAHQGASALSQELMGRAAEESIRRMVAKGAVYSEDFDYDAFRRRSMELYRRWEAEGKLPRGILEYVDQL